MKRSRRSGIGQDLGGRFAPGPGRQRAVLLLLAALLVMAVLGLGLAEALLKLGWGGDLSVAAVKRHVEAMGPWGVLFSIGLMVLHSFLPFPAEVVAIANGLCFGPWRGLAITWTGAMLGAYSAFGLTRWLGRPLVDRMVSAEGRRRIDAWAGRNGGAAIFIARLMPFVAFNLINYAAGLTGVSWWTFTWATGLGILPLTLAMVLFGDQMVTMQLGSWLGLAAAAAVAWLGLIWLRRRRRAASSLDAPPPAG